MSAPTAKGAAAVVSTSAATDEELELDTEMLSAEGISMDDALDDADATPAARSPVTSRANSTSTERPSASNLIARLEAMLKRSAQFRNAALTAAASASASSSKKSARTAAGAPGSPARRAAGTERVRATEAEEDAVLLQDELNDAASAPGASRIVRQPRNITATMRPYQLEALNWLVTLHDSQLNGILADEMGLGKTLETISMLAYLRESRGINGKHMIIVPKSTLTNWVREVTRWCPDFSVLAFHGPREEREATIPKLAGVDIIVTTYEVCIIERAALRKMQYEYVIIDEAHRIKNESNKLSQVVRLFKSNHRLLITGTPLQNNLHELWALLNFLKPELFSSHEDFAELFDLASSSDDAEREAMVRSLHKVLRPFILRRLKTEVATSLPPKVETKLFVGLSAMQREWYTKLLARDIDALNSTSASKTQLHNIMMQLRKVCNHPYLFEGAEPGPPFIEGEHLIENSGKMVLLDKLLRKLKADGSRVLIFSQMTRLLDILDDYCRYRGYDYCRIDGSTSQDERDEMMDSFNAPNSSKFVFLLSTRAGGLGINLQTADTVILYDSDWNPQMDLQAQDRAHRIGQTKQVNVYRFVTENSVEEKIVDRALRKLALDALIIQKGRVAETDKAATASELRNIVRFGAAYIFQSKDATITDDDIDAILARGKELTAAQQAKIQATSSDSMLDFSFVAEEGTFNTLEFEGKDYSAAQAAAADELLPYIAPPQRERKTGTYDVNQYYRSALNPNAGARAKTGPKEWKPVARHDFQFFQLDKLNELEKRYWEAQTKFKAMYDERLSAKRERKRAEIEEERAERRAILAAASADEDAARQLAEMDQEDAAAAASGGMGMDSDAESEDEVQLDAPKKAAATSSTPLSATAAAAAAAAGDAASGDAAAAGDAAGAGYKRSASEATATTAGSSDAAAAAAAAKKGKNGNKNDIRDAIRAVQLTQEETDELRAAAGWPASDEIKEMQEMQQEGFADWKRADLNAFISSCATHGRNDLARIVEDMAEMDKEEEDVLRYHEVFWARVGELKDGDKYVKQVERGEAIVQKKKDFEKILDLKVAQSTDPLTKLSVDYPTPQTAYTDDEDRFLILSMRHHGYGNWNAVRRDVIHAPQFRLDWFIRSRTPSELAKRGEYLMRVLEKEFEKDRGAAAKKGAVSAAAAKKGESATAAAATAAGSKGKAGPAVNNRRKAK